MKHAQLKITKRQITALANRTKDAYSVSRYASWSACAGALLRRGYTPIAAEAILRSKITRWAADQALRARASSADLLRFIDRQPQHVAAVLSESGLS